MKRRTPLKSNRRNSRPSSRFPRKRPMLSHDEENIIKIEVCDGCHGHHHKHHDHHHDCCHDEHEHYHCHDDNCHEHKHTRYHHDECKNNSKEMFARGAKMSKDYDEIVNDGLFEEFVYSLSDEVIDSHTDEELVQLFNNFKKKYNR